MLAPPHEAVRRGDAEGRSERADEPCRLVADARSRVYDPSVLIVALWVSIISWHQATASAGWGRTSPRIKRPARAQWRRITFGFHISDDAFIHVPNLMVRQGLPFSIRTCFLTRSGNRLKSLRSSNVDGLGTSTKVCIEGTRSLWRAEKPDYPTLSCAQGTPLLALGFQAEMAMSARLNRMRINNDVLPGDIRGIAVGRRNEVTEFR